MIPQALPQHHYIVYYDTHNEKWDIDWDTTYNQLQDGQIWIDNEWETVDDETDLGKDYYKKGAELIAHLGTLHSKGMIIAPSLGYEAGEEPEEE